MESDTGRQWTWIQGTHKQGNLDLGYRVEGPGYRVVWREVIECGGQQISVSPVGLGQPTFWVSGEDRGLVITIYGCACILALDSRHRGRPRFHVYHSSDGGGDPSDEGVVPGSLCLYSCLVLGSRHGRGSRFGLSDGGGINQMKE